MGAIAGIVGGLAVAALAGSGSLYCFVFRKKVGQEEEEEESKKDKDFEKLEGECGGVVIPSFDASAACFDEAAIDLSAREEKQSIRAEDEDCAPSRHVRRKVRRRRRGTGSADQGSQEGRLEEEPAHTHLTEQHWLFNDD
jgi:hypothetical protein